MIIFDDVNKEAHVMHEKWWIYFHLYFSLLWLILDIYTLDNNTGR